jgi:hypothetical protein
MLLFSFVNSIFLVKAWEGYGEGTIDVAAPPFSWRDDFNYNTLNEMEKAGWVVGNRDYTDVNNGCVILDNDGSVSSYLRYRNLPSEIYDWRAESKGMWIGRSYGSLHIIVETERHTYSWWGDGYYPEFVFSRDEVKVFRFSGYQPKLNEWFVFTLEKRSNTLYMYFNGKLMKTYIESDESPSAVKGVGVNSAWIGKTKYDYVSLSGNPSIPKFAVRVSIEPTGKPASDQWNFRVVLWDITKRAPDIISLLSQFPGVDLFVSAWDIIVSDKNGDGHLDTNEILDELASQLKDKLTRKIIEQALSMYLWPLSPEAAEHAGEIFIVGLSSVIGTVAATEAIQSAASIGFFTGTYSFGIPVIGIQQLSGFWEKLPFGGFSGFGQYQISALSPVDLTISDTLGRVVNKNTCEIPGANYQEFDRNEDGDIDIIITLPSMNMKYNLTVTPKPDVVPNDDYSIIVENNYISFQMVNSTVAELSQNGCDFTFYTYDPSTYEALEIGFPTQEPLETVEPYQNVTITVSAISRISQIVNVTIYFSLNNGTTWTPIKMTEITTNIYQAVIPGQQNDIWTSYKILAYDNAGNTAVRDNDGYYYQYHIIPEYPSTIMWTLLMLTTLIGIALMKKREKTGSHSRRKC